MWELIVLGCWIGVPIATIIMELRHSDGMPGVLGVPIWAFATALGIFWTGWAVIIIFVMVAIVAVLRKHPDRIAHEKAQDAESAREFDRQMRREERAAIEEDYKLGLIDEAEYRRALDETGFRT
ncbi:hypothetical protein [uncultured Croceicoccus sp.]|uniref:hypothetical protein n=1 Tax=uncultured Croceicoccus sp. TaxID=1295329 RepID=UPI00261E48E3|nr:hypothetical protein [uncultured Croceicoccus sp.]